MLRRFYQHLSFKVQGKNCKAPVARNSLAVLRSIMAKCAPSYDLTEVTVLTAGRRYRTISARWSFSCSSSPPAATAGNRLVRNMRGGCTGWPGFSAFAMARPRWAGIVDTCAFSAAS